MPAFVCLLYPRRGAGPSARFSAPGAEVPFLPDTDVTAFLSKSWFVLDTVTDDGVEDGSIQVFINDRLQGRMQPVSDSRFTGRYVLPGCRVRAGDRLRLEAEAGGFDLVGGETVIPDPVEVLSVDTVRFTRFGYGGYEYPSIRLYVRFRDKPDKRNYYRLIIEKQTEFQKGDSVITCSSMYRSELNYTDWLGVVYEDPVFRSTVTNPVIEQLDGTTCGARLRTICSMAKTIRSALLSGLSIVPLRAIL